MKSSDAATSPTRAWSRNNENTLLLLSKITQGGFAAVPLESRGRTVAEQLRDAVP